MSIKAIINSLTTEEKQQAKAFLKSKSRRRDIKSLRLFDLIDQSKTAKNIDVQLYGKPSRVAYHALSKRLQDNLIDFIAQRSLNTETSEEMDLLKLLLAGRIFYEQNAPAVALKSLIKAEKIGITSGLYALLNEVYHSRIQYAHLHDAEELPLLFEKANSNKSLADRELAMNMAYAQIKQQLKADHTYSIEETIEQALDQFQIHVDESMTYKSLYQLMNIAVSAATIQYDYNSITAFMEKIYALVHKKRDTADKHLFYHIEIIYMMALTSFRNKEFSKSATYLDQMHEQLLSQNKRYYKRYSDRYNTLRALQENYSGNYTAAIARLHDEVNSMNAQLTLVIILFQQGRYDEAYRAFRMFNHSDIYYEKKTDLMWVLKKAIIEILILIERDKLDLVLNRLRSFDKKFKKKMLARGEHRVLQFMQFVKMYYENPEQVTTETFYNTVEDSFEWKEAQQEDIFVMSYYAWLKSKMQSRNLYQVTLELVNETNDVALD